MKTIIINYHEFIIDIMNRYYEIINKAIHFIFPPDASFFVYISIYISIGVILGTLTYLHVQRRYGDIDAAMNDAITVGLFWFLIIQIVVVTLSVIFYVLAISWPAIVLYYVYNYYEPASKK